MEPITTTNEAKVASPAAAHKDHTYYVPLDEFILQSNTALTNGQLPEILPLLEKKGLKQADMVAKLADIATLAALDEQQKKEYGEQYNATKAYTNAENTLHDDYIDDVELARIVFKEDKGAKVALGLNGKRKQSHAGYAKQGVQFYTNALNTPAYIAALATKNITAQHLTNQKNAFENLYVLASAQQKETGEAQAATDKRDELWDALHAWMADFKETAIIALRKYPQYREQLGYKEV